MRVREGQERILWTKQHGQDTYYDDKPMQEEKKKAKKSVKRCKKCGSNTHSLPTHHLCPHNKQAAMGTDADASSDTENSDMPPVNVESDSDDDSVLTYDASDEDVDVVELEDMIVSGCSCGNSGRAHARDCPFNTRHKHARSPRRTKASEPLFRPGQYVSVHKKHLQKTHILCRVVECLNRNVNHRYRVCCLDGVISETLPETSLTAAIAGKKHIPLETWRTAARIKLKASQANPQTLERCRCKWHEAAEETVDLTQNQMDVRAGRKWIENAIYILHESDREILDAPTGWLNDKIIDASQKLLVQHFPETCGLEPPTLEQINGFKAHTDNFIQILNTGNNHWVIVSNIGCRRGVVNVYDTMNTKLCDVPISTIHTIARLTVCSLPQLTIKVVKVDRQKNSSDCGVLCVAMAFDLLSAKAPCIASYNSPLIRKHLSECLVNCCLSPFPIIGERSTTSIAYVDAEPVDLYCVCRMPEFPRDQMAQCEKCQRWFHQHCLDIEDEVFDVADATWLCGRNDCK